MLKIVTLASQIDAINHIVKFTDDYGISAVLFSVDFEKAFDSIDHNFLFVVLKAVSFGPQFLQWVHTLFHSHSCVMNNNLTIGYFSLQRGTKQGDPFSAHLFLLAVEVLH